MGWLRFFAPREMSVSARREGRSGGWSGFDFSSGVGSGDLVFLVGGVRARLWVVKERGAFVRAGSFVGEGW